MLFKKLIIYFSLFISLFTLNDINTLKVKADTYDKINEYTDVLEDLKSDKSFDETDYPTDLNKHDLKVIQIYETDLNNLFVYVYNPSEFIDNTFATSINISLDSKLYRNYNLVLLDHEGCFTKYIVSNFLIPTLNIRSYDIASISRKFNNNYDTDSGNDNTIVNKTFAVNQTWKIYEENDLTKYEMAYLDTIDIINPYHFQLLYMNALSLSNMATLSNVLAFDTDKKIDDLLNVSGIYDIQRVDAYTDKYPEVHSYLSGIKTESFDINADDIGSNKPTGGLLGINADPHTWTRIESVNSFIKNEESQGTHLSDSLKHDLMNHKWILRFKDVQVNGKLLDLVNTAVEFDLVTNVQILSLTFVQDGKTYSLGAVMDSVFGDIEHEGGDLNFITNNYFETIIKILSGIILFIIIVVFVNFIIKLFNSLLIMDNFIVNKKYQKNYIVQNDIIFLIFFYLQ